MSRLESECEALREQLEAVTRERNELLKGLNSPEVVGLRAELAAAQSQFKALQEHMGKSGPWPKQIEVDQAYWQPQVETLRAQLEEVTRERDEEIAESLMLKSERDSLAARVAKLEAVCERFADAVRSDSDEVTGEAMREWDAAVKPVAEAMSPLTEWHDTVLDLRDARAEIDTLQAAVRELRAALLGFIESTADTVPDTQSVTAGLRCVQVLARTDKLLPEDE